MQISLSPVRMDEQLSVSVSGDIVTVNGEPFNFNPLLEGATLPSSAVVSDWFLGDIDRIDGELHLTLRLPHGANAPEETRFPSPILITEDGVVQLPIYDIELPEDEQYRLVEDDNKGNETSESLGESETTSDGGNSEAAPNS